MCTLRFDGDLLVWVVAIFSSVINLRHTTDVAGQHLERRKRRRLASEAHLVLGCIETRVAVLCMKQMHKANVDRAEHGHVPRQKSLDQVDVLPTPTANVEVESAGVDKVGVVERNDAVAELTPASSPGAEIAAGWHCGIVLSEDNWVVGRPAKDGGKPHTTQDVRSELDVNIDEEHEAVSREELGSVLEARATGELARHVNNGDGKMWVPELGGGHPRSDEIHFGCCSFLGEQHD